MSGAKGAKLAARGLIDPPKKHYCPEHDKVCKIVMSMPSRKLKYYCPEGCELNKRQMVLK